jgi:hypothetical protein
VAAIRLNDAESDALAGLRHIAVVLYLVLRRRMNYADGIVGLKVGISWGWLASQVRVDGHVGMPPVEFDHDHVRRAAGHLESSGLIVMRSKKGERKLVIQCVLADTDAAKGGQKATRPDNQIAHQTPAQREIAEGHQMGHQTDELEGRQRTTPVSGNTNHNHNTPAQHGGGGELQFPEKLTLKEREGIANLITNYQLNGTAQLLLDELEGAMFTKKIDHPIGYARKLATAMKDGTFVSEKAHLAVTVRERRVAEIAREQQERESREKTEQERLNRGEVSGYVRHRASLFKMLATKPRQPNP